jgi:hypothetical protein
MNDTPQQITPDPVLATDPNVARFQAIEALLIELRAELAAIRVRIWGE